jgi:hypothetical protein
MNQNLKENERELIKLANFFRKRAASLMKEGKLSEEHQQVIDACEKLINALNIQAEQRAEIILQRENLKNIIKDNADCPKCNKNSHLKLIGIDKNDKGWKFNKYKCRRCNIEFVWNKPNNPWDTIPFLNMLVEDLQQKLNAENLSEEMRQPSVDMIANVQENINKLKLVVEVSDRDFEEMQRKELEMDKMIHGFKNHLLIERIKMDSWNNEMGQS